MTRIHICIPTYQRNEGLIELLESLRLLEPLPDSDVRIAVVVVDNNPDGRARSPIEGMRAGGFPLPISYHHETRPGVCYVRNTALAVSGEADFIAWVDDDETVEPQWLSELWRLREETGAAAVFGPVVSIYPPKSPIWLLDGDYHTCRQDADGIRTEPGYVGNCLMDLAVMRRLQLQFDPTISEIGGEDTLLFAQMLDLGEIQAGACNAVVSSRIPASRCDLSWLRRRWRRTGWTDAMVKYRKHSPAKARVLALADGIVRVASGGIKAGVSFLASGMTLSRHVTDGLVTLERGRGMTDFARGNLLREYARTTAPG